MGGWSLFRERIPARQLGSWCFAAVVPVLVRMVCGHPWHLVGALAIVSGIAVWAVWRWGGRDGDKVWLLRILFAAVAAGVLASSSAGSWPGDNYPAVPLILLGLAAWSAWKGPSAAARVGCVLFWFVLIMYLVVLGAGAKEVRLKWLVPSEGHLPWDGVVVALLPGAAVSLLKGKKGSVRILLPGAFGTAAALITAGILSPWVASHVSDPFYEMSRSLELLGIARRFEAVISAGMTVGWFCCLTLLFSVAGTAAERHKEGWGRKGIRLCAGLAGALVVASVEIPAMVLAGGACILWVVVPLLDGLKKGGKR